MAETVGEFLESFSYGSRTDLDFKFMARLGEEEGAEAIRLQLEEIGRILDDGDPSRLVDLFIELQTAAYRTRVLPDRYRYDDGPFQKPAKPLAESTVALLTSSGHFVAGDDPEPFGIEGMTQEQAIDRIGDFLRERPDLSTVPVDTPPEDTRVRHGGYDVSGSAADRNVALPVDRLRELEGAGLFGRLHPEAYSFVGAAAQGRIIKESAPQWADMLADHGIDVVLLVPV